MLWIVLLSLVTACIADYRYTFSCPPRMWINYPERTACRLTLSSGNSTASVQISTADGTDSITLQPGERHVQVMDQKFPTDNGIQNKGVIVTSEQELYCVVEQLDEYYSSPMFTDSTQIHPLFDESDQYAYYLASYKPPVGGGCASSIFGQFYSLAAAEDNTQVEIYDGDELLQSVTLNQYQTYTYVTDYDSNPDFDPTGLQVKSTMPVSVISGHLCLPGSGALITAIQPRAYEQFVAPHLGNSVDTGYTIRVIGHEDSTRVTINGEDSTVNEGKFVEIDLLGMARMSSISCDPPCSAYLVSQGHRADTGNKQVSLLSIIPTVAMYTDVHFTSSAFNYQDYVSIIVEGEPPYSDILLDGVSLVGDWDVSGGFSSTWLDISDGPHWLRSTSGRRLAAYVYGHSGYGGGGYGHSVWPGEGVMGTTTTATEPTTDAPETTTDIPARALPTYRIHTNGSAHTPDGSQISPLCAAGYVSTMSDNNNKMAAQVDGMIGATLCSQSPDMKILAAFVNLLFDQDKASVSLEYHMTVAQHHRHEDIDRCASEVALYVTDHANWQQPILPGKDACPDLVFVPEEFHHRGNVWYCPEQREADVGVFADNNLLYSHRVYDVLDTSDGSSLSQACVDKYVDEWTRKVSSMASSINQAVEEDLCEEAATSVTNYASSFSSLGTQAVVLAEFFHSPSDVTFAEFFRCSDAALAFSLSRASWGQPFLPTPPGCPALVAEGDTLVLDQERWQCL